jgi:hypothetical protein
MTVEDPVSHAQSVSRDVLSSLATTGNQTMVVSGANLGDGRLPVTLRGVEADSGYSIVAVGCRVTVPHSQLVCATPAAVGVNFTWRASVAGQSSNAAPYTTSYVPPVVLSVAVDGAAALPTQGGAQLVISGSNFGADAAAYQVTWNGVSLPSPFMIEPQRRIGVRTLPGEGGDVTIGLRVGVRDVAMPAGVGVLSFGTPIVRSVRINATAMAGRSFDCSVVGTNGIGRGGAGTDTVRIVIEGGNFGRGDNTSVHVGSTLCEGPASYRSHSVIECETLQCEGEC